MDVAYWQPAAEEAARNSQSLQSSSSKTGLARSLYRNRDKKMAFRFYDLAAIFFCARGSSRVRQVIREQLPICVRQRLLPGR